MDSDHHQLGRVALTYVEQSVPVGQFLADVKGNLGRPMHGTPVFLTPDPEGVPIVMRHHWAHSVDEHIVLMTIVPINEPCVADGQRVRVEHLGENLVRVTANFGFIERLSIRQIVTACSVSGLKPDDPDTTGTATRARSPRAGHPRRRAGEAGYRSSDVRFAPCHTYGTAVWLSRPRKGVADMTIRCPKCKSEFPLTERALAGHIESEVAKRFALERNRLIAEAARNAQTAAAASIEERDRTLQALRVSLGEYRDKLAAAQADQFELERARNELAQKLGQVDLEIEQRVRERLDGATLSVKETLEQRYALQIQDRDLKLGQARAHAEELQRQIAQGSQQLQGESQEVRVEHELRAAFPTDSFVPIAKGETGGDLLQKVISQGGQVCGAILWESKRTKNWNAAWLEKLRADQRASGADVSVLVSQAVPAGVTSFKNIDDVWVARRPLIVPIASMLRSALVHIALARATSQGRQTKAEMLYDYLTGSGFAHRIMPVLESLAHMRRDVESKRARVERELAREEQRIRVAQVSVERLVGDVTGIAGITIEELEPVEMPALAAAG